MRRIVCRLALAGLVILSGSGVAGAEVLKEDNVHVRTWNAFARHLEQLHRRLTSVEGIEVRTSIGGYAGKPKFYREEDYYLDGRLVSRVQWEREHPENLHAIEVYIRDEQGRVIRDYAAAFLPHYRNAPVQTLITLHRYNGDLHAFRSFDASGYRIVERCDGHRRSQRHHGHPRIPRLLRGSGGEGGEVSPTAITISGEGRGTSGEERRWWLVSERNWLDQKARRRTGIEM